MSRKNTEKWPVYMWSDEDQQGHHYLIVYNLYEQQVYILTGNRDSFNQRLQQVEEESLQLLKSLCAESTAVKN